MVQSTPPAALNLRTKASCVPEKQARSPEVVPATYNQEPSTAMPVAETAALEPTHVPPKRVAAKVTRSVSTPGCGIQSHEPNEAPGIRLSRENSVGESGHINARGSHCDAFAKLVTGGAELAGPDHIAGSVV